MTTETSFDDAVRVHPVSRSSNLFEATIPGDWGARPAAHGGFLQSIIYSTARAYFTLRHPQLSQPDPITSHVQFLAPVHIGVIRTSIKELSIGRRISVVQIEVLMPSSKKESPEKKKDVWTTCVVSTVTQGNLALEKGVTLTTNEIEGIPRREDCEKMVYSEFLKKAARCWMKLETWRLPGGLEGTFDARRGRGVLDMWFCFADGSGFDIASIGFIFDAQGGIPANYAPADATYAAGVFYPTLSIFTEIKRDPKGCKWLFVRMESKAILNGRWDIDVTVTNEDGELIAVGKHVSLVKGRLGDEDAKKLFKL